MIKFFIFTFINIIILIKIIFTLPYGSFLTETICQQTSNILSNKINQYNLNSYFDILPDCTVRSSYDKFIDETVFDFIFGHQAKSAYLKVPWSVWLKLNGTIKKTTS